MSLSPPFLSAEKLSSTSQDDEKFAPPPVPSSSPLPAPTRARSSVYRRAWGLLSERVSLESQGVAPLSDEQRTDAHFFSNFTLWLSMNATVACFSTGTLGPLLYGLSLVDSVLVIIFFNLFSCGVPSYFAVFGPRLGMRTMCIARYSFGFYGAILPALLNIVTFIGFCAVNSIVGGQTLAAINPDGLSINVGIIIIAIVSMVVSFCGYRVLHHLERWAWIPVTIAFILLAAFGGRHLGAALEFASTPATAGAILSFAAIVVGFTISWCGCSADFNTYMQPSIGAPRVFTYTFLGLYLPCALIQCLGAAFSAAALSGSVTTWTDAFNSGSVGSLIGVALEPLNGFGKFLLVILALGIICNNAPTTYAFSLSLQIVFPFLAVLPRWIFTVVCTAIYLPIAIVGAQSFAAVLNNFLGILGYWTSIFAAIFLVEHFVFRRANFNSYDVSLWNTPRLLPLGIAALLSALVGAGIVVLSMDQVWWRGPIAVKVAGPDAEFGGDLGFELGMAVAGMVYLGLRWVEKKFVGR